MNFIEQSGLSILNYKQIHAVLSSFPDIKKVILYGSRARGDHKKTSDIDLTMIGENLNSSTLAQVESAIDDLLLPYKVDISLFKDIDNVNLIHNINTQGVVFYEYSARK